MLELFLSLTLFLFLSSQCHESFFVCLFFLVLLHLCCKPFNYNVPYTVLVSDDFHISTMLTVRSYSSQLNSLYICMYGSNYE